MKRVVRLAPALATLAVVLSACPKKPAPAAPAPATPAVNQDSLNRVRARADSIARTDAARRDSASRAQAEADRLRMERERAMAALRTTLGAAVYFDYDSDALSDAARALLDGKLAIINANPQLRIRVAGHTDERGSDEYNLALGQRRAAAAKRYLTQHGVADDRIEVVSFGEERPAAQSKDETAYRQNRRDEFEITAGGDQLTAPSGSR